MLKIYKYYIICVFCAFMGVHAAFGQTDSSAVLQDTSTLPNDSLVLKGGGLFIVSKDSIDQEVKYGARDSIIFDYANKKIYLYQEAFIKYSELDLKACFIIIDIDKNEATAEPCDSLGTKIGVPDFKDRSSAFIAQEMVYNFKTRKGVIREALTKEKDIFVHGTKTKFIAAGNDSLNNKEDIIFNESALFTTCDANHPHFGIASNKQKVIPNKLVVTGPSKLLIHDVPLFWLPFAFFPISEDRRSGLIFPREYGYNYDLGEFAIRDIGYYIPIKDYADVKILTDLYFKGSYALKLQSNYKKRYKFAGNLELEYSDLRREIQDSYQKASEKGFSIKWFHNQDAKAHPTQSFGGSVQIDGNRNLNRNYNNVASVINKSYSSNITYRKTFEGTPWSLNATASHSQNITTRAVQLTLPSLQIDMRPIYPFKNKKLKSANPKWYEEIQLDYGARADNRVNTTDTLLLTKKIWDTVNTTISHNASISANFKLFKYINISPSVNYNEDLYFKVRERTFNPDTIFTIRDTVKGIVDTTYGRVEENFIEKLDFFRRVTPSFNMSTKLFGLIPGGKGWFRGLRHQLSPSASISFNPDYGKAPFNYYKKVDTDSRPEFNKVQEYSIFDGGLPSENFVVNFALGNTIDMKYFRKKDSTTKKLALIENFGLSGFYDVVKDSFSVFTGFGSTRFFNGITTISYNITLDPYERVSDVRGNPQRVRQFLGKNGVVRLDGWSVNVSTGFSIAQIADMFKNPTSVAASSSEPTKKNPSLLDLFGQVQLNHDVGFVFRNLIHKDTLFLSNNSLSTNIDLPISQKWKVNVTNLGYDFQSKTLNYMTVGLVRDLHCWEFKFNWSPLYRNAFSFFIGVKTGSLDFIKVPYSRNGNF